MRQANIHGRVGRHLQRRMGLRNDRRHGAQQRHTHSRTLNACPRHLRPRRPDQLWPTTTIKKGDPLSLGWVDYTAVPYIGHLMNPLPASFACRLDLQRLPYEPNTHERTRDEGHHSLTCPRGRAKTAPYPHPPAGQSDHSPANRSHSTCCWFHLHSRVRPDPLLVMATAPICATSASL